MAESVGASGSENSDGFRKGPRIWAKAMDESLALGRVSFQVLDSLLFEIIPPRTFWGPGSWELRDFKDPGVEAENPT